MKREYGKDEKRIVFADTDKRHADLKIRLRYDGITQVQFFQAIITGYLDKDPRIIEFIRSVKEKLAKQGIVYNNAFSNAPVCSVARSTLITGCYAPRIFTQFHRRMEFTNLPEDVQPFPYYLKQAGYYTSNNHKQDYNFILPEGIWDESSREATYKNRKNGQPFFHVQSHNLSHEGLSLIHISETTRLRRFSYSVFCL